MTAQAGSGTALEIAETGTFGTYRKVLDTPLWDVLVFLYREKIRTHAL